MKFSLLAQSKKRLGIVLEFPDENAFSDKYSILISAENEPLAKLAVKRIMDLVSSHFGV